MTNNNNLKLAENAIFSVEESLSKVFQERSNQVFQKLENILTIFKEEKVSTSPVSYTHLTLPTISDV